MPYPNSEIPLKYHKPYCRNPEAIGLYERVYNEKGKRTWSVRVLECPSCGVQIRLPHKYNTKKQKDKLMRMPELPKILSEKEPLESKDIQLRRIRTKEVQPVISPKEKKFRAKVKSLNRMYKNDEKYCPRLKGKIKWDPKLVERFLDVRPTFTQMVQVMFWPPLRRDSTKYANKYRGWIPDPDKFGYIKYDHDCYNIKWYEAWGKDPGIIDLNKLSEWEKLVIKEAEERMQFMESVIIKHHESNIQIYYPAEDEEKTHKARQKI